MCGRVFVIAVIASFAVPSVAEEIAEVDSSGQFKLVRKRGVVTAASAVQPSDITAAPPKADYVVGATNTNSCPSGSIKIDNEAECEAAVAQKLPSGKWKGKTPASEQNEMPVGCWKGRSGNGNWNPTRGNGKATRGRAPICKRTTVQPSVNAGAVETGKEASTTPVPDADGTTPVPEEEASTTPVPDADGTTPVPEEEEEWDVSWADMTPAQQEDWTVLGWTQEMWDAGETEPESYDLDWDELSDDQIAVAGRLGYDEQTWNSEEE